MLKDAPDDVAKCTDPNWQPCAWSLDDESELLDPPDIFNKLDILLDEMDEKRLVALRLLDDDLRITNIATWLRIDW